MAETPPPQCGATTSEETLEALPPVDTRKLTEKEIKRLRKREEYVQRELRIFLR